MAQIRLKLDRSALQTKQLVKDYFTLTRASLSGSNGS